MGPTSDNYRWFALQVKTRYEKTVANLLGGQDYECFLPVYKYRRRWSDRMKEIEAPLFPGYLFCRFNVQKRRPIVVTPGVLQIVGLGGKAIPVDDGEIAAVQTVVNSGLLCQPWPFLRKGDWLTIDHGAFRGLEGILLEYKGQYRLVVSISLLHRAVAVEIDALWVQAARNPWYQLDSRSLPSSETA